MRLGRGAVVAGLGAVGVLVGLSLVRASDHLDGPRATADPASDLTDVFAFTSPSDPARVVLAMAVGPYSAADAAFSPLVTYAFRVQRVDALSPFTLDTTARDVVCTFDAATPQRVSCTGPGAVMAAAAVGDPSGGGAGGPMRVFAGLRSDPAFFDRQGALATLSTGRASFTGDNAFAGANVLALVVEIDSALFTLASDAAAATDGARPVLAVAAETTRSGR